MSVRPSRRAVLKASAVLAALPVVGFTADRRRSLVPADPFTLGVASGDPAPDGAVIWTRLAPNPLADDGLGGMPARAVDVEWEVAADARFTRVEQRGLATAAPEAAHSVHVELSGLRPGADYFYRFRTGGYVSPAGRTRTAPSEGSMAPLTMCVASCSNFEQGWFTAYRRLADEHPDLVVHLGDYQYEYAARDGGVRQHVGPETVTLANYRQRYAQYKTDPDLQAAHAAAPWLAVFDDHELANNWADEIPEEPRPAFLARRAAALQAYYENMPLRRSSLPRGVDMQLYRRVQWGELATFHMLDTRQYRTDQPCGDEIRSDCIDRHFPTASLTGAEQERWLLNGFQQSRARWDVLGQQVFFSQVELTPGPGRGFNPDAWDGYAANRDRIVSGLVQSPVRNAVVLTGDVHSHWAAEVRSRFDDPASPVVATELVTTSISSGGDGSDVRDEIAAVLPENPHIRYFSGRRGYVRARITAEELRADFQVLPYVSRPGAEVQTGASFVVPDRAPELHAL
ncbi:MAG TPA: alkaline phosphatase D family protein [Mycobacterium sp.]|nr:alkaline phosphatase D family protein [Mycobacterium sp.]